jgi:RND family efflux transporter MFP subunit
MRLSNRFARAIIANAALALVPALAPLVGGCARSAASPGAEGGGPAATVRVVRVAPGTGGSLVLPARVAAREEVTVTARIAGRLTSLPVREGDRFRAGQRLATFAAPEARVAMESARAALEAATMRRDNARRQETRMDSLFAAGVAARRDLEEAQAERRSAEAGGVAARAALDQLQAGVEIEAPFDGVVVRRRVDPGVSLTPGEPLLDIRSLAVGEILASVPESALEAIRGGASSFQIGDGPWRPARLSRVDGMTDFGTRTRVARFLPAGAGAGLEAGAFARVRLALGPAAGAESGPDPSPISVPSSSLVRRGALTGVYVVRDQRALLRWIKVGREEDARVQVLAGLDAADAVVRDPAGLWDGRAVRLAP